MDGSYYSIHRSPQGTAKMKAWYRSRQRAMDGLAHKYPGEFRRMYAAGVEERPKQRRAVRQAVLREMAKKHPRVFRTFLDRELAKEPDYQVELRRGPRAQVEA